jgi:hypothetical protein
LDEHHQHVFMRTSESSISRLCCPLPPALIECGGGNRFTSSVDSFYFELVSQQRFEIPGFAELLEIAASSTHHAAALKKWLGVISAKQL